ncbi:tRNA (mnm(5)s(2)U34)-methyltransferase [Clostridium omnivorum]|uniref:rRNA methyltransferase n=1 Tax=Clostridium omnivorum TaxID=1604902 RepID=A0ABQ5NC34_9CLOT|nr:class I SAM-dependent methyltransferase [Clostridium sp. E14]GLC32661.1 rRNA methyltransferase [Clostridium sp. E14]
MYKYVGDISVLSHNIILKYSNNFICAVDCTLGNGHDTDFLAKHFKHVYAFDIQEIATENYLKNSNKNTVVINDSHDKILQYINEPVDCFIYNLGFLPGGDKNITTKAVSTINSINAALELLTNGGIIAISIYCGHAEGKIEREVLLDFASNLNKHEYGVMLHSFLNRSKDAPMLLIIEKNKDERN